MVLWHTSVRFRSQQITGYEERARFATQTWLEADAIEAALDQHTCTIEYGLMYQAREFLFR